MFHILIASFGRYEWSLLHVGSHVLSWVIYAVARRAEIAVDHRNEGSVWACCLEIEVEPSAESGLEIYPHKVIRQ